MGSLLDTGAMATSVVSMPESSLPDPSEVSTLTSGFDETSWGISGSGWRDMLSERVRTEEGDRAPLEKLYEGAYKRRRKG